MKNFSKALIFLILISIFHSCTPEDIDPNESTSTEEVYATGGNDASTVDDDRDGE